MVNVRSLGSWKLLFLVALIGIGCSKDVPSESTKVGVIGAALQSTEATSSLDRFVSRLSLASTNAPSVQKDAASGAMTSSPAIRRHIDQARRLEGQASQFQRDGNALVPVWPTDAGISSISARVVLDSEKAGSFALSNTEHPMRIRVTPVGAPPASAEIVRGAAIYRAGHARGGDVAVVPHRHGVEDFVSFEERPSEEKVTSDLALEDGVKGLRLVSNTLEFLDAQGAPRLRMAPPYAVGAHHEKIAVNVAVDGCEVNLDPRGPWGRKMEAPGAPSCRLILSWSAREKSYPLILDPSWSTTGNMVVAVIEHTATRIANGQVLVTGGQDVYASTSEWTTSAAQLFDPTTNSWSATSSLPNTESRSRHTAGLLANGDVIVAGGKQIISDPNYVETSRATAAKYVPDTGLWTSVASMSVARAAHSASILSDGSFLVAGGETLDTANAVDDVLATAERYDPSANAWTSSSLAVSRVEHTSELLASGKVIILGGWDHQSASKIATEIYDPSSNSWSAGPDMSVGRSRHVSARLADGKVIVTGGWQGAPFEYSPLASVEIYDPSSGSIGAWTTRHGMTEGRVRHAGAALFNGKFLVVGGLAGEDAHFSPSAEVYDPAANAWTTLASMTYHKVDATLSIVSTGALAAGDSTEILPLDDLDPSDAGADAADASDSGACVPANCDDSNPCTDDSCGTSGCTHTPKTSGTSCADGNVCNGAETCNAGGTCTNGTAPTVDDGNPCTTDSCDPGTGVAHTPVTSGTLCSDGNACNGVEACNGSGTCDPGTPPSVDDGNACTTDSCNPTTGVAHAPVGAGTLCADSNACNGVERCDGAGSCGAGTPPAIDDGNACTVDSCEPSTGVAHAPAIAGTSCEDTNVCNGSEVCNGAGACIAGAPLTVDDGNPCTADSCDPVSGVAHLPQTAGTSCSDGNACNGVEACNEAATCVAGPAPTVDDGNPCTADACDPGSGVSHTLVAPGTVCASGDACTSPSTCNAGGQCLSGTPVAVDDGNPCTADSCDIVAGVSHTPLVAGATCSDGNVCNVQRRRRLPNRDERSGGYRLRGERMSNGDL